MGSQEDFMKEYFGTYRVKLDSRGRFFVPKSFRDVLKNRLNMEMVEDQAILFLRPDYGARSEQCLQIYDTHYIEVIKKDQLNRSSAYPVKMDSQGRILIPSNVGSLVGLDRKVTEVTILASDEGEFFKVKKV